MVAGRRLATPHAVQVIGHADPIRYMTVVARGVFLQDMPLHVLVAQAWPMALIVLVTLTNACIAVRRASPERSATSVRMPVAPSARTSGGFDHATGNRQRESKHEQQHTEPLHGIHLPLPTPGRLVPDYDVTGFAM